ncbi:4-(cytidine 5'-diphospho)-2-C-methyl-D-erythritol kinase [uncultured Actinomyces sp.]|uniref:4-(cytidine 5'-diphospho)-2-C-methyl-D-erythritol kinase n=1 Tax=uncultured Actinomyces sp. TaxID=249061 RepID=UPI0025F9A9EF|nr:4-(cytidine 5'-diphospho)-2-C-methyl-D-erythritol kinase [uncultured Actinomyces sp.]
MSHLRAVPNVPHGPSVPTGPRDPSSPPPRSGSASSVRVEAPGKVNLFLSVGAPGPDGYHPLTTVFQAVRLIETVTARRQSTQDHGTVTLTLEEPDAEVPTDASNLAVRAAELLSETTGVSEGVDLLLRKRVPVAGGMAGGSADAAATLVACNALWGTGLSLPELSALAARLGADVPFPLTGATAVGSGRGDLVTPIMTRGAYHWVFALAEEGLSTPAVFRRFDELAGAGASASAGSGGGPAVRDVPEALTAALRAGDARALAAALHNDLQVAAVDLRPELAEVIAVAEGAGALRAVVSGSGPTIAALVEDPGSAQRVSRALTTSGLVADVLRADAPVAGARVVG